MKQDAITVDPPLLQVVPSGLGNLCDIQAILTWTISCYILYMHAYDHNIYVYMHERIHIYMSMQLCYLDMNL